MSERFTAACIQLNSAREAAPNIAAASELVRRAREKGADLIMTPEVSDMIEPNRALRLEKARREAELLLAAPADGAAAAAEPGEDEPFVADESSAGPKHVDIAIVGAEVHVPPRIDYR